MIPIPALIAADIGTAVILALLIRRYMCFPVVVNGRSMMDTLLNGEILLVFRYTAKREPRRHDIVVCRFRGEKKLFLKRIVAMPGETIRVCGDVVFINGEPLEERFPRRRNFRNMSERQLENGEYFVLGDNRTVSRDSRAFGTVTRQSLLGHAVYVLLPFKSRRRLESGQR